ncbi:MAG: SDR family NAD(P)-dependent oxidoreductase [Ignavibacteria bacterium]|nr:SDR family NAD(P)-dependent oxidoreductase [Ignavibacteria bacterium]
MNYFFITGTSRGIGKALAELLLKDDNNFVYGISRSNSIKTINYEHTELDLSNTDKVKEFEFPDFDDADSITLINNSAASMEVKRMGDLSSVNIVEVYNVNLISPSLLMNNFYKKYQDHICKRMILNISSGAAHKAIESWSVYCAAKAGLAMISEVADVEQKLKHPNNPIRIFSVGPGVVNTEMQTKLRNVSPEDFSMVDKFIEFYEKNQLAEPEDIAVKLFQIIQTPEKYEKVAISVKDI